MKATFNRSAPEDVAFTVELKEGAKLKAIQVNGEKINKTGNYSVSDNKVTLNSEYLKTIEASSKITFVMDDGSITDAYLTVETE